MEETETLADFTDEEIQAAKDNRLQYGFLKVGDPVRAILKAANRDDTRWMGVMEQRERTRTDEVDFSQSKVYCLRSDWQRPPLRPMPEPELQRYSRKNNMDRLEAKYILATASNNLIKKAKHNWRPPNSFSGDEPLYRFFKACEVCGVEMLFWSSFARWSMTDAIGSDCAQRIPEDWQRPELTIDDLPADNQQILRDGYGLITKAPSRLAALEYLRKKGVLVLSQGSYRLHKKTRYITPTLEHIGQMVEGRSLCRDNWVGPYRLVAIFGRPGGTFCVEMEDGYADSFAEARIEVEESEATDDT